MSIPCDDPRVLAVVRAAEALEESRDVLPRRWGEGLPDELEALRDSLAECPGTLEYRRRYGAQLAQHAGRSVAGQGRHGA